MALSTTFKTITLVSLFSIIFAGCSATRPEAVNNKSLGSNYLYASLNKDYKIKEFSNQSNIGRGFIVNTYQPFSFDDNFFRTSSKLNGACLWNKEGETYSKYESLENSMDGNTLFANIILFPFTLIYGFSCSNYHAFNYKSFDNDMKNLLPQSNAKKLVLSYDTLIETEHVKENNINKKIDQWNNISLQKLEQIKSKYLATDTDAITKKVKIVDKTGLYNNEKLPEELRIYKNNFQNPKLLQKISYTSIVNNSFPCTTVSGCVSSMNNNRGSIEEKYQHNIEFVSQQHNKFLQKDVKDYTELSKFYNVENNLKESSIEIKKKGIIKNIFYTVDIKSNKLPLNQKLLSTVRVTQVNYSDIFPKYKNKDKNIEIVFSPQTKSYKLINNTNKFIQIKSISLYYDGNIYNLTLNKDNNVIATELSPRAIKNIGLYDNIKESKYENLTKKQAKQKNFKFGFAIKYTIGEQTRNITLYNQHQHNLYSLIKGI